MQRKEKNDEAQKDKFKCVLCNDKFDIKEDLQSHFRGHGAEVNKRRKNYVKKIPEGATGIPCDVCGVKFSSSTLAIQHKFKVHPFAFDKHICSYCGKSFTLKTLLENHEITHSSDSPNFDLPCTYCNVTFFNASALEYHVKTSHKGVLKLCQPIETAPPSKKIKVNNAGDIQSVYFCHICGTEYVVKFNLQKHLSDYHTDEERKATPTELIRCTACDAFFYNRRAYEVHNIGHKANDLYVTDEQQRLSMVSRVDQDFDARRVMPLSEKYIPAFRSKRVNYISSSKKNKLALADDDDQLSPPSSPDPSDSEGDEEENKAVSAQTSAIVGCE